MKTKFKNSGLVPDIIIMVLCILMLALAVITLYDIQNKTAMFPYIILCGAAVNGTAGYKQLKQQEKRGKVFIGIGGVLFVLALVIFGGFFF